MEAVAGFDSWVEYRSFVERTQRRLYESLVDRYEEGGIDFREGGVGRTPGCTNFDPDPALDTYWTEPFYEKWVSGERAYYTKDHVTHNTVHAPSHFYDGFDPEPGARIRPAPILDVPAEDYREWGPAYTPDSDRHRDYAKYAPPWALETEIYLDLGACFALAIDDADERHRSALYDWFSGQSSFEIPLDYLLYRFAVAPFDRESFLDGSMVPELLDRLGDCYDRLAPLTVWGTDATVELATPDEALPDGTAHPRTWRVRATPALSGLDWAISAPEGAEAVVTVDRRYSYESPANLAAEGYHRGVVEECDDEFPADPGEDVLVAAANVVEPAGDEQRGPDGLTTTQQRTLQIAGDNPSALSAEQVESLVTWATTGEPTPRLEAAERLGAVGVATTFQDRAVDALVDALGDPDADVRRAATASLDRIAGANHELVADAVPAVVDRLDDEDPAVATRAASFVATVADADPALLSEHREAMGELLDAATTPATHDQYEDSVRGDLTRALERLDASGVDVVTACAEPLVAMLSPVWSDVDEGARAILGRVRRETEAFDAVVAAVEDRAIGELTDRPNPHREHPAELLQELASIDPAFVVATGAGDLLADRIRGEHLSEGSSAADSLGVECARLAATLLETHPEFVTDAGMIRAILDRPDDFSSTRRRLAGILAAVAVDHPELVEGAEDPILETLDQGWGGSTDKKMVRAIAKLAAVAPDAIGDRSHRRLRAIYEHHDDDRTQQLAARALGVLGDPPLSVQSIDGITDGRVADRPEMRFASVVAVENVGRTDLEFFRTHDGFEWLYSVVRNDDDPWVRARARVALVHVWIDDPELVENDAIPLDQSTTEWAEDGHFEVQGRSGRTTFRYRDQRYIPRARGIDVLRELLENVDDGGALERDRMLEALHRAAAECPEQAASAFESVLTGFHGASDPEDWRRRTLQTVAFVRAGATAPEVGRLVRDSMARALEYDVALVALLASTAVLALGADHDESPGEEVGGSPDDRNGAFTVDGIDGSPVTLARERLSAAVESDPELADDAFGLIATVDQSILDGVAAALRDAGDGELADRIEDAPVGGK